MSLVHSKLSFTATETKDSSNPLTPFTWNLVTSNSNSLSRFTPPITPIWEHLTSSSKPFQSTCIPCDQFLFSIPSQRLLRLMQFNCNELSAKLLLFKRKLNFILLSRNKLPKQSWNIFCPFTRLPAKTFKKAVAYYLQFISPCNTKNQTLLVTEQQRLYVSQWSPMRLSSVYVTFISLGSTCHPCYSASLADLLQPGTELVPVMDANTRSIYCYSNLEEDKRGQTL